MAGKFKVVSLKRLSEKTKIPYQKIYDNLVIQRYASLDENEKTMLSNALFEETKKLWKELGFKVKLERA